MLDTLSRMLWYLGHLFRRPVAQRDYWRTRSTDHPTESENR